MADPIQRPEEGQGREYEQAMEQDESYRRRLSLELPLFWLRHAQEVERSSVHLELHKIRHSWRYLNTADEVIANSKVVSVSPNGVAFLARASYMFTLELSFRAWVQASERNSNSLDVEDLLHAMLDIFARGNTFRFPPVLISQYYEEFCNLSVASTVDSNAAPLSDSPTSSSAATGNGPASNGASGDVSTKSSDDDVEVPSNHSTRNWTTSSDSSSDDNGATGTWRMSSESSSDDNAPTRNGRTRKPIRN